LTTDLSWSRTDDESQQTRRTSNNLGLAVTWPVAPALQLQQSVVVSRLSDRELNQTSKALAVMLGATGNPIPTLTIELQVSDRRVSQEAGTGFSRFQDSVLDLGWRPVPLISLQSEVRYSARARGDWLTRNSTSWEPFSGGSFKTRLTASQYRDTRTGETQRGGGIAAEWGVRSNLTLRGSMESVFYKTAGQGNSPLNSEVSGTWRF
jgi:hypothetical protein